MSENNKSKQKRDFIITIAFILILILGTAFFNYIADPYYIFKDSSIEGFNNVKTHKYTNKRTVLYSNIKITNRNKDIAFVGNCLLSRYSIGKNNIAFYTIPVATVDEVSEIIKNIHLIAPHIKKIYWGLFFQDLWFDKNDEVMDTLKPLDCIQVNVNDLVNLFYSWNTTKYSIQTIRDSIKNKGKDIVYIYPYKEIAVKKYDVNATFENIQKIKDTVQYAKDSGIDLIIYYSPIHITKKIHMYENNVWDKDVKFKKLLADITPFYDYSLLNENYNMSPLDEYSDNFIDNIHSTDFYNNLIVQDLLNDKKDIGILITKDNIESYIQRDTKKLKDFMSKNPELTKKIRNIKPEDAKVKINKIQE